MSHAVSHRFTVDDIYRMMDAGVFHEDDRVELLNGEIIDMAPPGPLHSEVVDRLISLFRKIGPKLARLRVQDPVRLGDLSQPQPDLVLIRPRAHGYADRHPGPKDILLAVEVSDTSVAFDRHRKIPLYAHAGVSEVWVIDLPRKVIIVHRKPRRSAYEQVTEFGVGEKIRPEAFKNLNVDVAKIVA